MKPQSSGTAVVLSALALFAAACGGSDEEATEPLSTRPPTAVGNVELTTRVPQFVREQCREVRKELRIKRGIRVVCPGLVPRGPLRHGVSRGTDFDRYLWEVYVNQGLPLPRYLHWIVGAGRRLSVRYWLLSDAQNEVKGLPRRTATEEVGGRTVLSYRYPRGFAGGGQAGHVAAFVSCGKELVFASLHGYGHLDAARVIALALAEKAHCPRQE